MVKKLWMGHASVRNYRVLECINKKEDLEIEFEGKTKTYPYKSLRTYILNTNGVTIKSKYGGRDYRLIDFPWN